MNGDPIPIERIRAAAAAIAGHAVPTPVVSDPRLDELVGATVLCKNEAAQRAGSFKFRGAFNRLSHLTAAERRAGVVAVSSGNHGAAVAVAAEIVGVPAVVFVPADAPDLKLALIEAAGAEIVSFDRAIADREAPARERAAASGAVFVHPFEDREVMAGQGTVALELFEEVGALDVLLVPMSGGGLMAGCASAALVLSPDCSLVGVEPSNADDTRRSLEAGVRVEIPAPVTIADGLALCSPGEHTFQINRRLVDEVITVSEEQILEAVRVTSRVLGVTLEPSGAVGIAAAVAHGRRLAGRRIGIVLSGGNIDPVTFDEITRQT